MKRQLTVADPEKMGFRRISSVQPDERGRIAISKLIRRARRAGRAEKAVETTSYAAYVNEAGQIILDPVVEIPAREQWIYKNPKALAALHEGLASGATGKTVDRGDFKKFLDTDVDE